jgi:Zn-dependent peptidase ImmA (M78 family)
MTMQDDLLAKELAQCRSPETLLAAILKHLPELRAPVDPQALAERLGISEVRALETEGATSALLCDIDKTQGVIELAAVLSPQRRRFAIAHQLGHFLLKEQRGDRRCTTRDLAENRRDTPHRKEEMQANRFAAGLLMPKPWFAAFVEGLGKPGIEHLLEIAAEYGVTLEAAASRYLDLSTTTCALVFLKDGVVRFARGARTFPALAVGPGDTIALPSPSAKERAAWIPAEVRDWIVLPREIRPPKLALQVLARKDGVQLVMLLINAAAERRADEEAEKLATESPKFGRPRTR